MNRILLVAFLLPLLCYFQPRLSAQESSDQQIRTAWNYLSKGSASEAEKGFRAVLANNPKNSRAALGLSFLYSWQHKYRDAWDQCESAIRNSPNPQALAHAVMATSMCRINTMSDDFHTSEYYDRLLHAPDEMGILRGMAYSRLGDVYARQGKISKSRESYAKISAITDWAIIGPFDNLSGCGYNKAYAPESKVERNGVYPSLYGTTTTWFVPKHTKPDGWVDLERFYVNVRGVFYACSYVKSETKQKVHLRVGTSGAFKVFLNDEQMLECEDEYNNDLDTYNCETELQAGWNKILMKICTWDISRNNFMIRLCDASGNPLPGLQYSTDDQSYRAKPGAAHKTLPNIFEQYYEKSVAAHPDELENYLLLAESYLRNDQGEKGELILRDALRQFPDNVIVLDKMMEAYIRNDKKDLVLSTLERIWAIDSSDVSALQYKFREAINNKNYDEAERLLGAFERTNAGEDEKIGLRLQLLTNTGKNNEAIDLIKSGYERFPTNADFAAGAAYLANALKNDKKEALEIYKRLLKTNYTLDVLSSIQSAYDDMGDESGWEDFRKKIAELTNDAPGTSYRAAKYYFNHENLERAEEMVKLCMECCIVDADYYEMLGDIALKRKDSVNALKYYKSTLGCAPYYSKMREKIRPMEGKKPVFSYFTNINVDSLIKHPPTAADYPDDESVIMLDDAKYFIYPEGGAESRFELLVRILKPEGIDDWKELSLGSVNVEKAVSIKANGTEVRADEHEGDLVFKQLQDGDFIYLRWRDYEHGPDRFFRHFNSKRYFNGKYPKMITRVGVHSPKDFALHVRSNAMSIEPKLRTTDEGVLREWRVDKTEALQSESSMPDFNVIGKYIEFSSIESWSTIARWYYDVTNNKPKATYEIKEKVAQLIPDRSAIRDEEAIRRIYQFITDSIRYSYVSFRQSGGTPQKARDVLISRIGDCKDVATLGISMLALANIPAEYCLVKTNSAGLETQLPSTDFDHVIVKAKTAQGDRYLDFTASNFPVGSVPEPDIDAFSLRIAPDVTDAQRLNHNFFGASTASSNVEAKLSTEGDVSIVRRTEYSGGLGAIMRLSFRSKGKKDNEKAITEDLSRLFPNVRLKSVKFERLDTLAQSVLIQETFDAPRHITDVGNFKLLKMPWFNTLQLDDAFSYEERHYPIELNPGYDTTIEEIRLTVPTGLAPVELPAPVKLSAALGDYSVSYRFENSVLIARRSFVVKSHFIAPSQYATTKEFFNSIVKEDERQILLGTDSKPANSKKHLNKIK